MTSSYIVLIPAYKPTEVLWELVCQLKEQDLRIVIVDDGSGEQYNRLFLKCSQHAQVLRHPENAGKGSALKTGLSFIQENYEKDCTVVTVDADGQHRVDDALAICQIARETPDSLVLGSRSFHGRVPLRSRFGNTVTRFVYHIATGVRVYDTQTGLRAFSAELIPALLAVPGERYEYEMNVLLHFSRSKISIREHEIETIYVDDNSSSHFNAVKDSIRIYKQILKFSASSIAGFLVDYAAYSLLLPVTGSISISNVIARVISAGVNFTLNRKFVFKSDEHLFKAAVQYILLAAAILVGNTLVLGFLVNTCRIHEMLAKLLTELMFFFVSWTVQRLVIFKKHVKGGQA